MAHLPHLIIASGGTGGHFYPTLGVACQFCRRGGRCTLLLGGKHSEEQLRIAREHGLDTALIDAEQVGRGILGKLHFFMTLPFHVWKARRVLKKLDGDLLLTMGSYVAVPSTLAWDGQARPLVVHEGNTVMGKANRLAMRRAAAVALTLPLRDQKQLMGRPFRLTGMPLRDEVVAAAQQRPSAIERAELARSFGLSPEKVTVFVFGGSQGAQAINRMLIDALPSLRDFCGKIQFLVATGQDDNHEMIAAFDNAGIACHVERIYSQVNRCFNLSDFVVCRGGASSICELAVYRKPMIIIPLPSAADNHQYFNARALVDRGAAKMIQQSDDECVKKLVEAIMELTSSDSVRQQMSEALQQFSRPDSTARVVDLLFDVLEGKVTSHGTV